MVLMMLSLVFAGVMVVVVIVVDFQQGSQREMHRRKRRLARGREAGCEGQ